MNEEAQQIKEEDIKAGERAERICQALSKFAGKLGIDVSQDALEASVIYVEELLRWNKAFNLVGRKLDLDGVLILLLDSLTPLAVKDIFAEGVEVLDIGSGAGMPGIPLYIVGGPFSLTMVEAQRKKVTFIRHICRRLGLSRATVYPGRLEEMRKEEDFANAFDVGLARAVMDPLRLTRLANPVISEGGRLVLFVGKDDAERLKKEKLDLQKRGWKLEGLRSTHRYVGRENYLAILQKIHIQA